MYIEKSLEYKKYGKINLSKFTSLIGVLAVLMLTYLFLFIEPSTLFWLITFICILIWCFWIIKQPVQTFALLIFIWITVYSRSTIPFFKVEGSSNRGGIALGDILWLSFVLFLIFKNFLKNVRIHKNFSINFYTFLLMPYILLASLLPIIGVIFAHWPLSYGLPGLRQIQWASFSILAYLLVRKFSSKVFINSLLKSVYVANIFHMAYSLLQLFASKNIISSKYIYLDQIFSTRFSTIWFFYPRTTGLLVNPNSYGVLGSMIFIIAISIFFSNFKLGSQEKILIIVGAVWAILFSGSRSAVLGTLIAFISLFFSLTIIMGNKSNKKMVNRVFRIIFIITFIILFIAILVFPILPDAIRNRFFSALNIFSQGITADSNAIGRVEMWNSAIKEYLINYPLGIWVPPSYALGLAIDSYYVTLLTQGTIIFLICFFLFIFGIWLLGFTLINRTSQEAKWVGFTLIGFSGIIAGASFTLSPLLEPQIIALFWTLIGLGIGVMKNDKTT